MRALLDFLPSYCPGCGKSVQWRPSFTRHEWLAKVGYRCDCGLEYQYIDSDQLLDAAEAAGGDLKTWSEV